MKQRLDLLLVERGLAETRTKAQALIMAGQVTLHGRSLQKAGQLVDSEALIEVEQGPRYVSRGGLKLESVADKLVLNFQDKIVLDVGASTGGFTDFALQHGAQRVYSVDVGRGQLAYRLRGDDRVVEMEQTDIRQAKLPEKVDVALIDVSFISLTKVIESVIEHLKPDGQIVAMAKPQFEATKQIADRYKGVIKDEKIKQQIFSGIEDSLLEMGIRIVGWADSGLAGAEGNIERFYLLEPQLTL